MAILRIGEIDVHRFRCFENVSVKLGRVVTAIAGHNATGKSTLLALLGHCAELKIRGTRPILHSRFRTEFSEIMKASQDRDQRASNVYTITVLSNDEAAIPISFRSTWQKYRDTKRFRLIPMKSKDRPTEKERKVSWPTLYLGLSRLYPIGESENPTVSSSQLSPEMTKRFFAEHKRILNLNDDPIDCSSITIKDTAKKRTYGIRTATYDPICNSAGQDNLSQILLAMMSFEVLRERRGDEWNGGLLLIDELDATLHPAAQRKLLKYLYDTAKKLGVQVVFTTHSLSLLEFVCTRCVHNRLDEPGDYELAYLTTRNQYLELIRNPTYEMVYNDMLITMSQLNPSLRRITVYCEDDEARWFVEKLLGGLIGRVNLPPVYFGYPQLLDMLKYDRQTFENVLFVLDGDVDDQKIATRLGPLRPDNIVRLPGASRPERLFRDFLLTIPGSHEVFQQLASMDVSKRLLDELEAQLEVSTQKERDKDKSWFQHLRVCMDDVYPYWEQENQQLVDTFRNRFIEAFNRVAKRKGVPSIRG